MKVYTLHIKHTWPREEVIDLGNDEFEIHSKQPLTRGKANKDAVKLLARHLGLHQTQLMLTAKEGNPVKQVLVME